ncbi:MAG TPA: flagellar filament capping protein FliD [Thermoanaerobacterales bacterium]|nr:flagellar filament capping protein FliD [Thermoanaerobacterales bacterium]
MYRAGGIISGLDTHTLIDQLMQIERQPIATMEARRKIYTHRKNLWNEINTSLLSLKNRAYELTKGNIFEKMSAISSDENVATAKADKKALPGTYRIEVSNLATNHSVSGNRVNDIYESLGLAGEFTIKNGNESAVITVDSGDSLRDIRNKINAKEGLGIAASIIDNRLILTRDETGAAEMGFEDPDNILVNLGILNESNEINVLQKGLNARFKVNGLDLERSSNNEISDVLEGVNLTLTNIGETTLEVGVDVDAIYSQIEGFVKQYNSLIDLINTRLSEEKVKIPQTELEERRGLLRGDINLISIKGDLRQNLYTVIPGLEYNLITQIGLATTSEDYGKTGRLEIDEEKLKEAIKTNPQAVKDLFAINDGDRKGIAVIINEQLHYLTRPADGIVTGRLQNFDSAIRDIDKQIQIKEDRLADVEKNYWAKFTAMEKALSTMYNQSQWLTAQLNQISSSWS